MHGAEILALGMQHLPGGLAKDQESQHPGAEAMKTSAYFLLPSLGSWLLKGMDRRRKHSSRRDP